MSHGVWSSSTVLRQVFTREVQAAGARVSEFLVDGPRSFGRAVSGESRDVRPGDTIQGGVALRADEREIRVHPYTYRLVCKNGAIRARALQGIRIVREPDDEEAGPSRVEHALSEAIRTCLAPSAFAEGVAEMRSALHSDGMGLLIELLPMLDRMPEPSRSRFVQMVLERFETKPDPDRSAFGLMNAVTSTARDTRDPEARWRLEELGGCVPALRPRVSSPGSAHARAEGLVPIG